nr:hypothetical protein Q903MT_gene5244 [Picea sitchensis]
MNRLEILLSSKRMKRKNREPEPGQAQDESKRKNHPDVIRMHALYNNREPLIQQVKRNEWLYFDVIGF